MFYILNLQLPLGTRMNINYNELIRLASAKQNTHKIYYFYLFNP